MLAMQVFNPLILLVIGVAFGQITSDTRTVSTTVSASTPTPEITSTTQPSSTSTSEVPTSATPETPTTINVLTTVSPDPVEGFWNVSDGNVTCILANLAVEFKVPNRNESIPLSPLATSERSNCHETNITQSLVLEYDNYVLALEFENDPDSTYVKNLTLSIDSDVFYNDSKLFLVKHGNSYLCKSTAEILLGNATMHIFKIQIQAFRNTNETAFSKVEECELDDSISDVVPIAVSCALAGLIVIVLIAYLIGRRRVRQTGYTSV